jgi:hypothetical protein
MCKYFSKTKGPDVKFTNTWGPRCNVQQVQGLSERFMGFNEFLNISIMEKSMHRVHGAMDRWRAGVHGGSGAPQTLAQRCLTGVQRTSARGRWCSPVVAEGNEGNEAVLEGCSTEHERQQRGSTTVVDDGGRSFTSRGR